jgi:hypothetical protein
MVLDEHPAEWLLREVQARQVAQDTPMYRHRTPRILKHWGEINEDQYNALKDKL